MWDAHNAKKFEFAPRSPRLRHGDTIASGSRFAAYSFLFFSLGHSFCAELWAGLCLITLMFHSSISRETKSIFPKQQSLSWRIVSIQRVSLSRFFTFRCCLSLPMSLRKQETKKYPILARWLDDIIRTMVLIPKAHHCSLPNPPTAPCALTTWAGNCTRCCPRLHVDCILSFSYSSTHWERESQPAFSYCS